MFDKSSVKDGSSGKQHLGLVFDDDGIRMVATLNVSADLEEGELPCSPKVSGKVVEGADIAGYSGDSLVNKQSWSSVVAQDFPKSGLVLDFFPLLLLLLKMVLLLLSLLLRSFSWVTNYGTLVWLVVLFTLDYLSSLWKIVFINFGISLVCKKCSFRIRGCLSLRFLLRRNVTIYLP